MEVINLALYNFRNFRRKKIDFSPSVNLITGKNGLGKTNIIEAFFVLSAFRSFRGNHLIFEGETSCRLEANLRQSAVEPPLPLVLTFDRSEKKASFKGIGRPLIELAGTLQTTLFLPETLEMVSGSPEIRRRTLNLILGLGEVTHLKKLGLYGKLTLSRNRVLKNIRDGHASYEELGFWEEKLSETGEAIQRERLDLIDFLNQKIADYYRILSRSEEKLSLVYSRTFQNGKLLETLRTRRPLEIKMGETLFGPHRESFEFELAGQPLKPIGSRGEVRSAALAFKRAEADWYLDKQKTQPVFLLDDVLAELDRARAAALLELVKGGQLIITATDWERIPDNILKSAHRIDLKKP